MGIKPTYVSVIAASVAMTSTATKAAAAQSIQSVIGNAPMNMTRPSEAWVFPLAGMMIALYVFAIIRAKRWPEWWQTASFFFSVILFVAVVTGPLDRAAWDRVFAGYIVEQILIYLVSAPLLLLGIPDWMLRPALEKLRLRGVAKVASNPIVACAGFTLVFAGVHYPTVCNMICHARPFYAGIRGALLVAGLLLWWPVLSPLRELTLPRPKQMLYLFFLIIPMTAVAAPITLSYSVIYTWLQGPPVWGLSPLMDQRVGGIFMWVGQGLILAFSASMVFMRWVKEEGK